jgi:hypothetical protein
MSNARTTAVQDLIDEAGGSIWDEHAEYPVSDWQAEVADNDTRASYWDWVLSQKESRENDEAEEDDKE